jgi:hypothetical protein
MRRNHAIIRAVAAPLVVIGTVFGAFLLAGIPSAGADGGPAPIAIIVSPADNQTYNLGQVVPTSFGCIADAGFASNGCFDSNGVTAPPAGTLANSVGVLDTSIPGNTVTVNSADGQTGTTSINYTVAAAPTATITSPGNNETYAVGAFVQTTFSCTEALGGPGVTNCEDSNSYFNASSPPGVPELDV